MALFKNSQPIEERHWEQRWADPEVVFVLVSESTTDN